VNFRAIFVFAAPAAMELRLKTNSVIAPGTVQTNFTGKMVVDILECRGFSLSASGFM
jgi:hypothetical protein